MKRLLALNGWAIFAFAAAIESAVCVWTFLVLPLIPLGWPASMPVIQFISSGVLQLVALPVLAVASKRSGAETMTLIRETHDTVMQMHQDHQEKIDELHKKHDALHDKVDRK